MGLAIVGADGIPLKRAEVGEPRWRGILPATQDYIIQAHARGAETDFQLDIKISPLRLPEAMRVRFAAGATSATLADRLEPGRSDRYILRALAGQRMSVRVSPREGVALSVEGEDGSSWSAISAEGLLTIARLPVTQDYIITLTRLPGYAATPYSLVVNIP